MNVGIVGLGLIGASFAKGFKKKEPSVRIYAANRTETVLDKALEEKVIDGVLNEETIPSCDLIILALYPELCVSFLEKNKDLISEGCIVTDVCGTKGYICREGFRIAREKAFSFVGGHPMAGNQFSGYDRSEADMFEGSSMILVPEKEDDPAADRLKEMLAPLGFGMFAVTDAAEHDRIIAYTSQMAHVLANVYIMSPTLESSAGFTGGSFRDMTRVAYLNPGMWTELFMANRTNLIEEIDHVAGNLSKVRDALEASDPDKLYKLLEEGSRRKEESARQETTGTVDGVEAEQIIEPEKAYRTNF